MAINITNKSFKIIKELIENKHVLKSHFTSKKLIDEFIGCNCVYLEGKPQQVYLKDENALFGIIRINGKTVNSIKDLDYFINQNNEPISRNEIPDYYVHTKAKESKSFNGLMVNVINKLEITFKNKKQYIYPMDGMGLFLHYIPKLELADDVIIVGVENPQIVWEISKYKYLFDKDKKYLFISISEYKTKYQYKWLESFEGEYIHFGDFDLAGINIYLNSIVPKLKKSKKYSFLMPDNIYEIIKKRNHNKDYSNQTRYFNNIEAKDDLILQELITFIKQYKITLEQEML